MMVKACAQDILAAAEAAIAAYKAGGKVLLCGNGGSAADAQHIAAELVGKLREKRAPLAAIALTTNTSILTAVGNDWSFDEVFVRQVECLGGPSDVLFALSTSGRSPNVIRAVEVARGRGMKVIGFTGEGGEELAGRVDICIKVPSTETPRIQEGHITAGHIICDLVERAFLAL
ncbi:MAG: SIS domain-containing protein [Chloroflexi bacterium]|nr:SIS domain-containing protein [Chloroflexota bacterium]